MAVFVLPTSGSTAYRGKYPTRARMVSGYAGTSTGRHVELNNGTRLWTADRYAPAVMLGGKLTDDYAAVLANAVPMTDAQYAVLLTAAEKLRGIVGIAGHGRRERLEAEVRALVDSIKVCSSFYAKRNAEDARKAIYRGESGRPMPADKPFRVYNSSPNFKGCFDFPTLAEARDYLAAQVDRRAFITSGAAPVGPHSDSIDPLHSFIVWHTGTETLADEFFGYVPDADDRLWKKAPLKLRGTITATSDLDALPVETVSETPVEIGKVETIDMTPTWRAVANIFIACLENGTEAGRVSARAELRRMAALADERNAFAETLATIQAAMQKHVNCKASDFATVRTIKEQAFPDMLREVESDK